MKPITRKIRLTTINVHNVLWRLKNAGWLNAIIDEMDAMDTFPHAALMAPVVTCWVGSPP